MVPHKRVRTRMHKDGGSDIQSPGRILDSVFWFLDFLLPLASRAISRYERRVMMHIESRLSNATAKANRKAWFGGGKLMRGILAFVLLLVLLLGGVLACGEEDLELPGEIAIPDIPDDGGDDGDDGDDDDEDF